MSGLIMLVLSLLVLPRFVAAIVAVFFLAYGVKIIIEDLRDQNVPDRRKAVIVLVAGVVLHVLVYHPEAVAWLPRW